MISRRIRKLVFEVIEETEGGNSAECLTENIFTQGDTWEELRTNVKDATEAYFFDGLKSLVTNADEIKAASLPVNFH